MQEGSNNVFYGNTMIAQKGVQIGKGGDLMKLFVNWGQLNPVIDANAGSITAVRNCTYQQAGDQVKVMVDMTIEVLNLATQDVELVLTSAPPFVGASASTNNVVIDIDTPATIDGTIAVSSSGGNVTLNFLTRGVDINPGDSITVVGEVAYTTTN